MVLDHIRKKLSESGETTAEFHHGFGSQAVKRVRVKI
jgi:hypothetical protein